MLGMSINENNGNLPISYVGSSPSIVFPTRPIWKTVIKVINIIQPMSVAIPSEVNGISISLGKHGWILLNYTMSHCKISNESNAVHLDKIHPSLANTGAAVVLLQPIALCGDGWTTFCASARGCWPLSAPCTVPVTAMLRRGFNSHSTSPNPTGNNEHVLVLITAFDYIWLEVSPSSPSIQGHNENGLGSKRDMVGWCRLVVVALDCIKQADRRRLTGAPQKL